MSTPNERPPETPFSFRDAVLKDTQLPKISPANLTPATTLTDEEALLEVIKIQQLWDKRWMVKVYTGLGHQSKTASAKRIGEDCTQFADGLVEEYLRQIPAGKPRPVVIRLGITPHTRHGAIAVRLNQRYTAFIESSFRKVEVGENGNKIFATHREARRDGGYWDARADGTYWFFNKGRGPYRADLFTAEQFSTFTTAKWEAKPNVFVLLYSENGYFHGCIDFNHTSGLISASYEMRKGQTFDPTKTYSTIEPWFTVPTNAKGLKQAMKHLDRAVVMWSTRRNTKSNARNRAAILDQWCNLKPSLEAFIETKWVLQ
ncbi:hypothetical protein BJ508DRAFT_307587 [Ascobolus immersus RN42]|uniref:Uncharacterized protein n=1 Tax=Ascobolus immersus RN42 TaxID=1160509 RepID=A0A3N4I254_ASCIM|nr:hypothetical protein BJ508DRAFT_307587 [Ascobolus immersus RN42]